MYRDFSEQRRILKDEKNIMVQWMNLHWNNSFINRTRLPLLCENSGAIFLVLVGPTAGSLAGQQSEELLVDFEIKILHRSHR